MWPLCSATHGHNIFNVVDYRSTTCHHSSLLEGQGLTSVHHSSSKCIISRHPDRKRDHIPTIGNQSRPEWDRRHTDSHQASSRAAHIPTHDYQPNIWGTIYLSIAISKPFHEPWPTHGCYLTYQRDTIVNCNQICHVEVHYTQPFAIPKLVVMTRYMNSQLKPAMSI